MLCMLITSARRFDWGENAVLKVSFNKQFVYLKLLEKPGICVVCT